MNQFYHPYNPYQQPIAPQQPLYDPYIAQQQRLQQMMAQQQQAQQAQSQQMAPAPTTAPPQVVVVGVDNEKEAHDAAVDLSGVQQVFARRDGSAIYAKRFNVSTAKVDFEIYEKKKVQEATQTDLFDSTKNNVFAPAPSTSMLDVVTKFTERLDEIQNGLSETKTEIKKLREDVKNDKFGRNSQVDNRVKPANEGNNGSSASNGSTGQRPGGNNGNAGGASPSD
jgi:hypothetical protein